MLSIVRDKYCYKIVVCNNALSPFESSKEEVLFTKDEDELNQSSSDLSLINFSALNAYRRVVDYGRNNDWNYFITLTVDDRKLDLSIESNRDKLLKLIVNQFRNYRYRVDNEFRYIIIPELGSLHGRLHFHGLVNMTFNQKYLKFMKFDDDHKTAIYRNDWFYKNIGANQFIKINYDSSQVTGYITKYITKYTVKLFPHYYYCSHGLKVGERKRVFVNNVDEFIKFLNSIDPNCFAFSGKYITSYEIPLDKSEQLDNLISQFGGVFYD